MKRIFLLIALLLVNFSIGCWTSQAQCLEKKTVSLELAKKIAAVCEADAIKNK
jgi:hypothetical protein